MDQTTIIQIIILVILLFLSSFFSASETALMSLNKMRVRHLVEKDGNNAILLSKLVKEPTRLLGAILVGNNIVNISASSLATSIAIKLYGSKGVGIATGVLTLFVLVFGEITPKSIATTYCEGISLKIAKPMYFITSALSPIVIVLTKFTGLIVKIFGVELGVTQPSITEAELKTIMNLSHEEGVLEGEEKEMILNVFEFADNKISDVMTPRIDIVDADVESTYDELIDVFKEGQFSRIPIYEEDHDNIIGILYIKDLVLSQEEKEKFNTREYIKQPYFTYEFMGTAELFAKMRAERVSMAVVLDEYGTTVGLITIEDLVEEIVGEIVDEYDVEEEKINEIKKNEYIIEGSTRIEDMNEAIGTDIQSEEFDSIGGYILGLLGRLPENEEVIEKEKLKFIIENVENNRVEKVRIIKRY